MTFIKSALIAVAIMLPLWTGPALAKDTITIGVTVEPPHLDPSSHVAGSIREIVYANVYQGLMLTDEHGQEFPVLAESVDQSDDGLTYTFKLRQNVVFHDGTPFDASVVRFSLDRARGPDSVNAGKRLFEPIDSIETPDAHTAVVKLKHPVGSFLYHLGSADAIMVAPGSADDNQQSPVGTGPFKFDRWVKGDRIELSRFDDYWGEPAAFERAVFRIIPDAQAQVAALKTGDIDAFPVMGAPETLAEFEADNNFQVVIGQTQGEAILALNHRREPYSDVSVRRAISHALDREAISEGAVAGYGTPIGSHFPPSDPDYTDLTDVYPYDPARARALLADAGYGNGFEAQLILPPFPYARRAGEIIQAFLAEVGITTNIEVYQGPQWLTEVFRESKFDMTVIAHTEPRDIDVYAREDWYIGYDRQEFRDLAQELSRTSDPERRTELNQAMQRMLAEDAVVGFLFQLPKTGVWRAELQGFWTDAPVQANDLTKLRWVE